MKKIPLAKWVFQRSGVFSRTTNLTVQLHQSYVRYVHGQDFVRLALVGRKFSSDTQDIARLYTILGSCKHGSFSKKSDFLSVRIYADCT
jgi:hypothetical protein